MSGTAAGAAAARAIRTRVKHDRWIAELSGAGWTVIQAGHVTAVASAAFENQGPTLAVECGRCHESVSVIAEWTAEDPGDVQIPLPRVLHAVSGHTCEERS
jgi:hypothetical protein